MGFMRCDGEYCKNGVVNVGGWRKSPLLSYGPEFSEFRAAVERAGGSAPPHPNDSDVRVYCGHCTEVMEKDNLPLRIYENY